jgi:hypothetical protein
MKFPRLSSLAIITALLLLAASLRIVGWLDAPPGMRYDEMTVVYEADDIRSGDRPIYMDGSAEEPLYHYLFAIVEDTLGPSLFAQRWLSGMLGVIAVAATYALGKQMFNMRVGLIAAAISASAFWALMYSRMGLRIIALPAFVLIGMLFLWTGLNAAASHLAISRSRILAVFAGTFFGLSAYTYSATRLLPFIFIVFFIYLFIFNRSTLRRVGLNLALTLIIGLIIAAPLAIHIANVPVAERRLGEVEGPLDALRRGEVTPLINSTVITAGMFAFTGDPESLYNIPNRPVFDLITGVFFYLAIVWCLIQIIKRRKAQHPERSAELEEVSTQSKDAGDANAAPLATARPSTAIDAAKSAASISAQDAYTFVLIWLLFGLIPPMLTWPAASNSHGILAQTPAFLIAAIGLDAIAIKVSVWRKKGVEALRQRPLGLAGSSSELIPAKASIPSSISGLIIGLVLLVHTVHSVYDYFFTWANLPGVRIENAANITATAQYFAKQPVSSPIVFSSGDVTHFNPWSATAFRLIAPVGYRNARWFDARSSFIFPQGATDLTLINSANDDAPAPLDSRLIEDLFPVVESSSFVTAYFSATHLVSSLNTRLITLTQAVLNWPSEIHLAAPKFPVSFGDHLDLLGYEVRKPIVQPGKNIRLTTYWRAQSIGLKPLSIFVHVLNDRNEIAAQWDGFTIDQHYVQTGDIIVQVHFIPLPADFSEGTYTLQIGLYEYKTSSRIPIEINGQALADRVLLQSVQIKK